MMDDKKAPLSAQIRIDYLKSKYHLQSHPEGGFYVQQYKSIDFITPSIRFGQEPRSCATAIYYLLTYNDFSAFHKIKSDETWHFYEGNNLLIHIIAKNGELETITLGNKDDHTVHQYTVSAEHWFAAELEDKNGYAFVGCTVAPGFEFKDFELANATNLSSQYPINTGLINRLSRQP